MTKFGFTLQLEEYSIDLVLKTAKIIEELGLHAVFVNDHYMKYSSNNIPETFLTLTAIALQTKRLKIGTAVTPIPLRPAPQLAKIIATLDYISKGRFLFGVGIGWYQPEFEGYGSEFLPLKQRALKTIEGIRLMKRMWTENEVNFKSRYYNIKGNVLLPKPIQTPYPPILVGSKSKRMCRFAARECDGWIPSNLPANDYEGMMNWIIDEAEKHDKDRDDLTFVYITRILTGPHMDEVLKYMTKEQVQQTSLAHPIIGPPEACVEKLQEYVSIGVDLILLRLHHIANTSLIKEQRQRQQITFIRDKIISQL